MTMQISTLYSWNMPNPPYTVTLAAEPYFALLRQFVASASGDRFLLRPHFRTARTE